MTAPWFEIDPAADRAGIEGRYLLRDPWGDYARPGELIPITFTGPGPVRYGRALVTGHDTDGRAVVLPIDPAVVLIESDPPEPATRCRVFAVGPPAGLFGGDAS